MSITSKARGNNSSKYSKQKNKDVGQKRSSTARLKPPIMALLRHNSKASYPCACESCYSCESTTSRGCTTTFLDWGSVLNQHQCWVENVRARIIFAPLGAPARQTTARKFVGSISPTRGELIFVNSFIFNNDSFYPKFSNFKHSWEGQGDSWEHKMDSVESDGPIYSMGKVGLVPLKWLCTCPVYRTK